MRHRNKELYKHCALSRQVNRTGPGLAKRAPSERHEDPALHLLDQQHSLVHGIAPTLLAPALFSADLPLPQVRKLPHVVYRVQGTNLAEPGPDALHDVLPRGQSPTPVSFPLEEVAREEGVCAELEKPTEVARRSGGPEGEFLHQIRAARAEETGQRELKLGEGGGAGQSGEGLMIPGV